MPKEPYHFFFGEGQAQYETYGYVLTSEDTVIQMQCWGWLGDLLKFLGEGEAHINPAKQRQNVMINAVGFQFAGMPQYDPVLEKFTGGGQLTVPAPFAMREPKDTAECLDHKGNLVICDKSLNAKVKSEIVLEWEWQPKTCWPGGNCVWVNDIDGYYVYETDPLNNTQKYMKEVIPPEAKVVALPLPWGYHCYGVKAYVEGPEYGGQIVSEMATYCPNQPLQPEKLVLTPTDWLTTGGQWIQSGDCDMYGTGDTYANANKNNGFGNNIGEVLVGSYFVDDEEQDCYREGNYSAGVKFAQPVLPSWRCTPKSDIEVFNNVYGLRRNRPGRSFTIILRSGCRQSQKRLECFKCRQPLCRQQFGVVCTCQQRAYRIPVTVRVTPGRCHIGDERMVEECTDQSRLYSHPG